MKVKMRNRIGFFLMFFLCYSCSKHGFNKSFSTELIASGEYEYFDSVKIVNTPLHDNIFNLNIEFVKDSIKKRYSLQWVVKNDSLNILLKDKKILFFKLENGFTDSIDSKRIEYPDDYYPFGNLVTKTIINKDCFTVSFDRGGDNTISSDLFITEIKLKKNKGITALKYFTGKRIDTYKIK